MEDFGQKIVDFFKNAGWGILFGAIILVVGLVICWVVKKILKAVLLKRAKRDEAMVNFVAALVDVILKIIVLITALATMGINTASIIAVIGTCGVAIGLALKDSLGNIASGIMIIFNKPFKKDDYVEIAGEEGRISAINLFNTTLRTDDNTEIIVPNSEAVNNPIINYDACGERRIVIEIAVEKGTDIQPVRETVLAVVADEPLVTADRGVSVCMDSQNSNGVVLKLKCYAPVTDYWTAKYNLTENVYTALKEKDILTPNMQVDVHEGKRPAPIVLRGKGKAVRHVKENSNGDEEGDGEE